MVADSAVLEQTQILAKKYIKTDPELSENPRLKSLVSELFKETNEYGFN